MHGMRNDMTFIYANIAEDTNNNELKPMINPIKTQLTYNSKIEKAGKAVIKKPHKHEKEDYR